MLEIHESMSCEERVRFWKEAAKFWHKEAVYFSQQVEKCLEESDV